MTPKTIKLACPNEIIPLQKTRPWKNKHIVVKLAQRNPKLFTLKTLQR